MDPLLLFFALPVSTILLSIVLQKILNSPLLVAATFFAIYLIVTYAAFDSSFLVYTILYTILAYVTAVLTRLVCNLISRLNCLERRNAENINNTNATNNTVSAIPTVTTTQGEPLLILTNGNSQRRNGCSCNRR